MPDQPKYHSQVLDHLGLVTGMFVDGVSGEDWGLPGVGPAYG
jgi:hypothetical protein